MPGGMARFSDEAVVVGTRRYRRRGTHPGCRHAAGRLDDQNRARDRHPVAGGRGRRRVRRSHPSVVEELRGLDLRHQRQVGSVHRDGGGPHRGLCGHGSPWGTAADGGLGGLCRGRRHRSAGGCLTSHSGSFDILPTMIGIAAGLWALSALWPQGAKAAAGTGIDRRRFLVGGAGVAAAAATAAAIGQSLGQGAAQAAESRSAIRLPKGVTPVVILPGAQLDVKGITPYVMPNDAFYRIDTALVVPQLDTAGWSLKVHGMVDQEVTIDWATLLTKPMQDALVTLMCVSNEVGGDLTGNAVWTGWPVRELLMKAGPQAGADMVLSTSIDGWTAGTPLSVLTDDRNALLAIAMNGEPLPLEHGFPVRMVVPGLYGYVSATKWVTDLKVTRFADDEGYWTPRGWSARGPVKTESRIDVPRAGDRVSAGKVAVAGIAWAQHRGIRAVEVRVDDGAWQPARLASEPSIDSWRQWVLPWQAVRGSHTITVRATDTAGVVQTQMQAPPAPDGATGWHTITVNVD